jgi:hypothetical protein
VEPWVTALLWSHFSSTLDSMKAELKPDRFWKKSRIAARILLKHERSRLSSRDRRLAHDLADDTGVTNRLIGQAIHCLRAPRNNAN